MHTVGSIVGNAFLLSMLAIAVPGCAPKSSLEGKVLFEGEPVANGSIALLPADGKGPAAGGTIQNGTYFIPEVTPGPKIAQIVGVKEVPFVASSAELEAMSKQPRPPGANEDLVYPADTIPEDAVGNNEKFDVQPGVNQRDFQLSLKKEN
jgi:hypothetical protein